MIVDQVSTHRHALLQVEVHSNLGDLWKAQGQQHYPQAHQCYQDALKIRSSYAPAWRGLGDIYRD